MDCNLNKLDQHLHVPATFMQWRSYMYARTHVRTCENVEER